MFFKIKSNILFRNYVSFGYITDNRNFGYELTDDQENNIGDRILSESGAVFLSVLSRKPQCIDNLVKVIQEKFEDSDFKTIKKDAIEFYCLLERDGFVASGETLHECNKKDEVFAYKNARAGLIKNNCSSGVSDIGKSTQEFFEEYFNGKPQLNSLHVEITSKCNERCVHCYIPHDDKINDMEPDLFYDLLRQCSDMKLLHLTLSGGEPMLNKNFCDFLIKCNDYNFSVNVLSNLTLLDDKILKEMKRNPLLGVQVSLYSMNPAIHERITQVKGSFEKTKNGILKLIRNNIPMQISCPIMKQNKNCYDDVKKWAKNYKINVGDDYVIIARYNHTTQNLNNRLSINEVKKVVYDAAINNPNYMEQMKKEVEKKKNITLNDVVCSVCYSSICVSDNGNVYPCAGWQDNVVGNVKETSLRDIWNNSEKVQHLRDLCRQDFPKCVQCPDKEFCSMCLVRNANEDPLGNPLVVNEYFCEIAKLNRKMMFEWRENV